MRKERGFVLHRSHQLSRAWRASFLLTAVVLAACSGEVSDGDVGTYVPPASTTGSAADGAVAPEGGYDPSITFDWPEADPTLVCRSGAYTGQFNCQMNAGGPLPSGPYGGPVSFLLRQAPNGEFLEIENGTLRGTVAGLAVEFVSDLVGKLDCTTDEFRAEVVNGTFFGGTFAGMLEGRLDRRTQTVTGTWSMGLPLAPPCVGPFSVVRSP